MEYRVKRYELSYGIPNESLEDKIIRLEELEPSKYTDIIGNEDEDANRFPLYHGLGFHPLDKLESILIHKFIYPGKMIPTEFESMDGTIHYLPEHYYDEENVHKGEYIGLLPFSWDDIEFDTFIRPSIYFALRGDIKAEKTFYLKFDDYIKLRRSKRRTTNLYSYAYNDYLASDPISIDNLLYIGIDSKRFNIPGMDVNEVIARVIELMEYYQVDVPFYDLGTTKKIFQRESKKDEMGL